MKELRARPPYGQPINWTNTIFFALTPVVGIAGIWLYARSYGIAAGDLIGFAIMMLLSSIAVIPGYHRYFAHRTYAASRPLEAFYLLAAPMSFHPSALVWASEHRDHHKFVDTPKDPYNIRGGFWWAHMGWIVHGSTRATFDNVPDLLRDPLVRWQHRHWRALAFGGSFLLPMLIGLAFGRPLGGLLWGGFVRLAIFDHCTFLINSAAHIYGGQPYTSDETARDSWWLDFFTFGEGHHNFHHAFPGDYRIGHKPWHFDPAKWWIASMAFFGLASRLHRTPEERISAHAEVPARDAVRRHDELPQLHVAGAEGAGALQ